MKNLKFILFSLIIIVSNSSFAQEEMRDTSEEKKVQTFTFKENGKTITYKIRVIEKKKSRVMLSEKGNPKLEFVTKMIHIDNDSDNAYDRYIVLRYKKMPNDSFKLIQTKKGFAVMVDDKNLEYIVGKGTYHVDNKNKDYFIVDEFDML